MDNISNLEQKILSLSKGERKTRKQVREVQEALVGMGFDNFNDGSCLQHGKLGGVIGGEPGKRLTLWDCGCWQYHNPNEGGCDTLAEAVLASLVYLLKSKASSIQRRNRQVRDLRRALKG